MTDRLKKNIIELTRRSAGENILAPKLPLIVLADNVRSLHNIGALLRTADAFAVREVIMAGISGTPPHPEISKSALGAEDSVKWHHADDALTEICRLKEEGWRVCVLEQTHNSTPLQDYRPEHNDKLLLVVGNEVHGVNQLIVDVADVVLEIPQYGAKHSLNVSTSAAIAMYQLSLYLAM
ncbi:MAG: RNA methyltransferase [Muribaculaceae bacterium]|nr:RNA methyltransferase [Muribaculaceae bacterium]